MADHDSYIAAAPEPFRPLLARLRAQLAAALPEADEVIEYNMPGFRIGKAIVAGYAAFSKQCGLYVAPAAIAAHAGDIAAAGLKASKTGVTFSAAKPIPDDLVEKLASASRKALA
ncbi:iron chaperone [Sphingoaurantiacus capsulatus]|uniref:Iron chaperone n=1 Tax=Sphingoaurantiacus capsulatus TaxID=1771310 RepID=A0ABV7XIC0_9SPHN